MSYTFVFRVDASIDIGTGHVMRCLTLAEALALRGADSHFICREHTGHLIDHIRAKGFVTHVLPKRDVRACDAPADSFSMRSAPVHFYWLGTTQEKDAEECASILSRIRPDWLVVDHYALNERWETSIKDYCSRLLVIDDLADRSHQCDLLVDQTLGRRKSHYSGLVPIQCDLLCGPRYALLRPEFAKWRPYSLRRRASTDPRHILITMGGVDKHNMTGRVLEVLGENLPDKNYKATVVLGRSAPWLEQITAVSKNMSVPTEVRVGVNNMAQLMAESDLAIGAAGATAWERCCLGLPSFMFILARNQRLIARSLERAGAARVIDSMCLETKDWFSRMYGNDGALSKMSLKSAIIVDGEGTNRVVERLLQT